MKKLLFLATASLLVGCATKPVNEARGPAQYNGGGGGYGQHRPGDGRPGPGGDNRPGPGPGGPGGGPRSSVIGEVKTISQKGEVFGWGCDLKSRAPLRLVVYLNDRKDYDLNPEADVDIRSESRMGLPDRDCGAMSGFKFTIPEKYMNGQLLRVGVVGLDRDDREIEIGIQDFKTPVNYVDRGLFQVADRVYLSNGSNSFCLIANQDQVNLQIQQYGGVRRIDKVPQGMRLDGQCELIRYPRGLFRATKVSTQAIYFSSGDSFCGIPFPGMLNHMRDKYGLKGQTDYLDLPRGAMADGGSCKVEGVFQFGGVLYYSNGVDAFCEVANPGGINRKKVPNYEGLPPQQRNDGRCQN